MKKKVLVCVGTRPNLIKITQLEKAFLNYPNIEYILLHTGQHYDTQMNDVFFNELGIKKPDIQFSLNASSQIDTICQIMLQFEKTCLSVKPDLVVVPGDVNSSFACAFVANRLDIPVAHIESGLRSFDVTMPEETNRILIDKLSSIHFVTEPSGEFNLLKEGYSSSTIKMVGNSMIDSLIAFKTNIDNSTILEKHKLAPLSYSLFTFHRPINVDNEKNLRKLLLLIKGISETTHVVFPIHPRTRKNISLFHIEEEIESIKNLTLIDPLGYLDFLKLIKNSAFVVTDSGGVQEETTFLKIPCLTIRPNTERPVTVTIGTNTLLNFDLDEISKQVSLINNGMYKLGETPNLWDGQTSERIVKEIALFLQTLD